MPYDFFENAIDVGFYQSPKEFYRGLNQAYIDKQWDNSTAVHTIYEQIIGDNGLEENCWHKTEAWFNYVVGQGTSLRNGEDFVQLTFRDIDHISVRGQYFKFENNYWIVTFTDDNDAISHSIVVRRCNNALKMIDPESGKIFVVPCVVEYDMTSPSEQVSRYVITPNNHANIIVQANDTTLRLFKTNTRFMLGGRPFKLSAFQNTLLPGLGYENPTILYFDMYLDELHAGDNKETGIADNGLYEYAISINSNDLTLESGAKGQLFATVTLNGVEVERPAIWQSSDDSVVEIDDSGEYKVVGKRTQSATITACLENNSTIQSSVKIKVDDSPLQEVKIYFSPYFNKIREYQTIDFDVYASFNGVEYEPDEVKIDVSNENILVVKNVDKWQISCLKKSKNTQHIIVSVKNIDPIFEAEQQFDISAVSMMG